MEAFQVGLMQVLDSLDAEGNMGTKQDISYWAHSADGCQDDEDSYRLDIQGKSFLGCPDNT